MLWLHALLLLLSILFFSFFFRSFLLSSSWSGTRKNKRFKMEGVAGSAKFGSKNESWKKKKNLVETDEIWQRRRHAYGGSKRFPTALLSISNSLKKRVLLFLSNFIFLSQWEQLQTAPKLCSFFLNPASILG